MTTECLPIGLCSFSGLESALVSKQLHSPKLVNIACNQGLHVKISKSVKRVRFVMHTNGQKQVVILLYEKLNSQMNCLCMMNS